jgi:hypothetical protein
VDAAGARPAICAHARPAITESEHGHRVVDTRDCQYYVWLALRRTIVGAHGRNTGAGCLVPNQKKPCAVRRQANGTGRVDNGKHLSTGTRGNSYYLDRGDDYRRRFEIGVRDPESIDVVVMKRCPTCNQTFTDPHLSFCIDDGTPLIKIEEPDPDATVVSPSGARSEIDPAAIVDQEQTSAASDWRGPAYQPPGQFGQPPPEPKRRAWPWVVGIVGLLVLALAGLGIAAAIYVPRMMKAAQNSNENRVIVSDNTRPDRNSNTNSNWNRNSNLSANDNDNTNANANTDTNAPAPTSQELVLSDLKNLEDEWTVANLNADKKKLERILADDYVGTTADGVIEGKAEYLRDIKRDTTVKHWEFQDLKLSLKGNRATLSGNVRLEGEGEDQTQSLRFTDKFVWRDGRWQAVGSEVTQIK